jgi:hypothetical protein
VAALPIFLQKFRYLFSTTPYPHSSDWIVFHAPISGFCSPRFKMGFTGRLLSYALALSNNSLFVAYDGSEHGYTVGEYDATTGAAINANLITGLNEIFGLAVSDNKLFVCTGTEKKGMFVFTVGKYDVTTGAAISANFIKGLNLLAAKGNTLYGLVGVPPTRTRSANTTLSTEPRLALA